MNIGIGKSRLTKLGLKQKLWGNKKVDEAKVRQRGGKQFGVTICKKKKASLEKLNKFSRKKKSHHCHPSHQKHHLWLVWKVHDLMSDFCFETCEMVKPRPKLQQSQCVDFRFYFVASWGYPKNWAKKKTKGPKKNLKVRKI